jgi:hypothetical protein
MEILIMNLPLIFLLRVLDFPCAIKRKDRRVLRWLELWDRTLMTLVFPHCSHGDHNQFQVKYIDHYNTI